MQIDLVTSMNLIGVLTFAFTGAMKAIDKQLDLLGIFTLALATSLGGGVLRDALINRTPYAFSAFADLAVIAAGVVTAAVIYTKYKKDWSNRHIVIISDAIGLAAFTATGASIAYQAGILGPGMVFLAVITAVGGGIIADLLLGRIPFVLREDFYATCSIAGGISFYLTVLASFDAEISSLLSGCITFFIRILAIQGRWSLPKLTCR